MCGPGRFLRWLASIFVRGQASRFVLGDLDEAMVRDLERGMFIWRARGRYLRNLVASSLNLASARVRPRAPNLPSVMSKNAMMDNSILALRTALRNMLRAPGTALAVLITLGLGIGPTTMMYGVADRILLSPPSGITQPDRVVRIFIDRISIDRISIVTHARQTFPSFSYPDLLDFEGLPAFQSVAGYTNQERTLGAGANAERIQVQLAGAALFPLLGIRPHVGRFYSEEEDRVTGGSMVAVLSDAFWTRRFGRDPTVIGRELRLGSALFTVIGVAPRGFTGASIEPVDAWLPLRTIQAAEARPRWAQIRGWGWLRGVARLADGVEREGAEAEATHVHRIGNERIVAAGYDPNVQLFPVVPGQAPDAGPEVTVARWLLAVAGLVMVIACANVANLMLLRSVRRRREMAIRVAVGLGRGMLWVQLVVESAIYAALAATSALLLARWGATLVYRLLLPQLDPGAVFDSPGLMLFTATVAALAAGLSVFLPLILSTRRNVIGDLKEAGRGRASHRLRSGLIILQVTLSVVLLAGAGLFLRSLDRISELNLGFSPGGVILASVETSDDLDSGAAIHSALSKLARAPVVESAAATLKAPLTGFYSLPLLTAGGDSILPPAGPYFNVISPGYFHVMGMHIVHGRAFAREDTVAGAAPVMIVNQELALRVFGQHDPLGECLIVPEREGGPAPCTRIVGVIVNHRLRALEEPPVPVYYLPEGHPGSPAGVSVLTVRASDHSDVAVAAARKALLEAGPDVRYVSVEFVSDHIDALSRSWTLGATLLLVFGGLALTVAAVGLYAVLAFETAERDPEFSLRSALGASPGRVIGMVFEATMTRVMLGTAIGFAGVAALSSYVQGLLFRTSPTDPVILGAVGGVMLAVAAAATARPAIRAARARPADALRGAP